MDVYKAGRYETIGVGEVELVMTFDGLRRQLRIDSNRQLRSPNICIMFDLAIVRPRSSDHSRQSEQHTAPM